MERQAVKSTNIRSMGWAGNILEIEFHSGGTYQYIGVPWEIWDGFRNAESKGQFFHRIIRGQYREEAVFEKEGESES